MLKPDFSEVAYPGILIRGGPNFIVQAAKKTLHKIISYHQKRWKVRAEASLYFFSPPPHRNFEPPFSSPSSKLFTTVHLIALQQRLMASLLIRFNSALIPSSQLATLRRRQTQSQKTVGFPGNFMYKALRALL